MSISYEKVVKQDLNLGFGTVDVTMPAGGTATGDKIGLHTFTGHVNVTDFGALGDGVSDDTAAINAAGVAAGSTKVVWIPPGDYRIMGAVSLSASISAVGARFLVSTTGSVVIGSTVSGTVIYGRYWWLPVVEREVTGWGTGHVGITIVNALGCFIVVPRIICFDDGLKLTAIGTGCVHNEIHALDLLHNKRNLLLASGASGWVNDNTFHLQRLAHTSEFGNNVSGCRHIAIVDADTTYGAPNNNRFYGGSIEGDVAEYLIEVTGGQHNVFSDMRYEATSPKVLFAGSGARGAQWNVLRGGYGVWQVAITESGGSVVTRNGIESVSRTVHTYSTGLMYEAVTNNNSSSSPIRRVYPHTANVYGGGADWVTEESASYLKYKATADVHPRIWMNLASGRMLFGDGTVSPPSTLEYASGQMLLAGAPWYFAAGLILQSGVTANRPSAVTGQVYFDTTLGIPIFYTGAGWVNAAGVGV